MLAKVRTIVVAGLLLAPLRVVSAAETPSAPEPREFVMAYSPRSVNLDPLHTFTSMESQFFTAIYEGLLVSHPLTLEPQPGVAERWESSDKGRVYRFTLRSDAVFSNGDPVRARNFVDSWLRMIDPAPNAEYSFLFDIIKGARAYRTGALKDPSKVGIRAVSDRVLEVELEKPAAHFLKVLCHISFVPLHPTLLKSSAWNEAKSVIGNGPFVITERSDTEIVLEKNALYWDAKNVGLPRIRIRFMDDPAEATDGYIAGRIQWSTIGKYDNLVNSDKVEAFPMFGTSYFFFACDKPPWSDWRVRRGLALLVPWDQIRTKDYVFPTEKLIPSIPSYPQVTGIAEQNIDEGKKLLADAGFPEGRGLPPLVAKVANDSTAADLVRKMAEAWKTLAGLQVDVREIDPEKYFAESRNRDYALGISTWIGDYADPLTFLQLWTTGSNLNDARFSDKEYDAAVEQSVSMLDNAKRYRKLADAEQILLDRAVILPLDHTAAVHLIDLDRVDGWFPNPLDVHPFKFIKFKEKRVPKGIAMAF
jgi:peptide/nickel transport system substrate-binding protein/oligopeptide transport system substrate-binding protein